MNFKDFKKELKDSGLNFKSKKDWELFLPHKTNTESVQSLVAICRKNMLVNWHIIFPELVDEKDKPEIWVYWGDE